jgi:hypothetical protein
MHDMLGPEKVTARFTAPKKQEDAKHLRFEDLPASATGIPLRRASHLCHNTCGCKCPDNAYSGTVGARKQKPTNECSSYTLPDCLAQSAHLKRLQGADIVQLR